MVLRFVLSLVAATLLAGCASLRPAAPAVPWLDDAFAYDPARVTVQPADLFRLPQDLRRRIADTPFALGTSAQRVNRLLTLLFGADRHGFGYESGHTTVAADTWQRRRGDCISLTILTYAVAREAGFSAQMQEVRVPALYDRRAGFDLVNQHVNVLLDFTHRPYAADPQRADTVIDFDPELATTRRGDPLEEDAIAARFYNNLAVEHLERGDRPGAYAHFRAAVRADPGYASAYTNLAVLYRLQDRDAEAEAVLRAAIELTDRAAVPLHALHALLLADPRRGDEARAVGRRLEALQAQDPYHWLARGTQSLDAGDARQAVKTFEAARELAPSFPEVHRGLAIAHARNGDRARSEAALKDLAALGTGAAKMAALRRKLGQAGGLPSP